VAGSDARGVFCGAQSIVMFAMFKQYVAYTRSVEQNKISRFSKPVVLYRRSGRLPAEFVETNTIV